MTIRQRTLITPRHRRLYINSFSASVHGILYMLLYKVPWSVAAIVVVDQATSTEFVDNVYCLARSSLNVYISHFFYTYSTCICVFEAPLGMIPSGFVTTLVLRMTDVSTGW